MSLPTDLAQRPSHASSTYPSEASACVYCLIALRGVLRAGAQKAALDGILSAAAQRKLSPFEIISRSLKGSNLGGIKPAQKKALKPFVEVISQLTAMAAEVRLLPLR